MVLRKIEKENEQEVEIQEKDVEISDEETATIDPLIKMVFIEDLPRDWKSPLGRGRNKKIQKAKIKKYTSTGKVIDVATKLGNMRSRKTVLRGLKYKIPILGGLLLKKDIRSGFITADIVFQNMNTQRFVVPMNSDFVEVKVGESLRFFSVTNIRDAPETYLKVEAGVPVATFFWDYPNPIPIRPVSSDVIDLNTFGTLILRARAKAAAQPIKQFLDKVVGDIKLLKIGVGIAAVGALVTVANVLGFIGG